MLFNKLKRQLYKFITKKKPFYIQVLGISYLIMVICLLYTSHQDPGSLLFIWFLAFILGILLIFW
jgi:hypothetical protein